MGQPSFHYEFADWAVDISLGNNFAGDIMK